MKKILAKDNNIRFVLREWPVLNEGSMYAAKAALASRKQGLYEIAVLDSGGDLCYSTSITEDVIGYADEAKVLDTLHRIRML